MDDAILSCAGSLCLWTSQGHEVTVLTVFTTCGEAPMPIKDLYVERRKNDIDALKYLPCSYQHLGFTDAPFRNKNFNSFASILFHHENIPEPFVEGLEDALTKAIDCSNADTIFFPLGIGGHIDHHIVYLLSLKYLNKKSICYYEDLPYLFVPGWRKLRLKKLGIVQSADIDFSNSLSYNNEKETSQKKQNPNSLFSYGLKFIENYISNDLDAEESNRKYLNELKYLEEQNVHGNLASLINLECISTNLNTSLFLNKCKLILFYQTEWPTLFGNDANNIKALLRENTSIDYSETFWQPKASI